MDLSQLDSKKVKLSLGILTKKYSLALITMKLLEFVQWMNG